MYSTVRVDHSVSFSVNLESQNTRMFENSECMQRKRSRLKVICEIKGQHIK